MTALGAAERSACRLPGAFVQERFFGAAAPARSAFPLVALWRIGGALELELVVRAVSRLCELHEALRTTLDCRDGTVEQLVWEPRPATVELLTCATRRERTASARALLKEIRRPMSLRDGPLTRTLLLRLGPTDHVLALVMHHAVSDGMSREVVRADFEALLAAECSAGVAPPPPPALHFGDVASWERAARDHLAGTPSQPSAVADRLRLPGVDAGWTTARGFSSVARPGPPISPAVVRRIRRLARASRAPFGVALDAAVVAALLPYAGRSMLLGVMRSGREDPQLRRTVGFLAEPLPVVVDLRGPLSFRTLLGRVRDAHAAAEDRRVPLAAHAERFERGDDVRGQHPFDAVANYLPAAAAAPETLVPGARGTVRLSRADLDREQLRAVAERGPGAYTLLDFQLSSTERDGLSCHLVANERIVDVVTLERMAARYAAVLRAAAVDPDRPLVVAHTVG